MDSHLWRYLTGAATLTMLAACATVPSEGSGEPTDRPLRPGTYQLTAQVTYHTDSNVRTVMTHRMYTTHLYVQGDGTMELYEDDQRCTAYADLPDDLKDRRRQPGPGHHFFCGDRTWYSDWHVWATDEGLAGTMSAKVEQTVRAGLKCVIWNYSSGRGVCEKQEYDTRTGATIVEARLSIQRSGG